MRDDLILREWYTNLDGVRVYVIQRGLHIGVVCGLGSGLGVRLPCWISLRLSIELCRDRTCWTPYPWWFCFTNSSMGNCVYLLGASSTGPEIGLLPFSVTPPSCLDSRPCVGTSHLWRLRKLPRLGVSQRIRHCSLCPSILKRDMPIRGFVFPTTVPRRLTVRFLLLWCHWGYCPCVGCVLCTTSPLLFPVLEMLRFLPFFDGIGFWLCWSMRLILWFVG